MDGWREGGGIGRMEGWKNKWRNGWVDGWVGGYILTPHRPTPNRNGLKDGWRDRMDERMMGEWMDGWTDGWMSRRLRTNTTQANAQQEPLVMGATDDTPQCACHERCPRGEGQPKNGHVEHRNQKMNPADFANGNQSDGGENRSTHGNEARHNLVPVIRSHPWPMGRGSGEEEAGACDQRNAQKTQQRRNGVENVPRFSEKEKRQDAGENRRGEDDDGCISQGKALESVKLATQRESSRHCSDEQTRPMARLPERQHSVENHDRRDENQLDQTSNKNDLLWGDLVEHFHKQRRKREENARRHRAQNPQHVLHWMKRSLLLGWAVLSFHLSELGENDLLIVTAINHSDSFFFFQRRCIWQFSRITWVTASVGPLLFTKRCFQ